LLTKILSNLLAKEQVPCYLLVSNIVTLDLQNSVPWKQMELLLKRNWLLGSMKVWIDTQLNNARASTAEMVAQLSTLYFD
jgi:hypothetical protein